MHRVEWSMFQRTQRIAPALMQRTIAHDTPNSCAELCVHVMDCLAFFPLALHVSTCILHMCKHSWACVDCCMDGVQWYQQQSVSNHCTSDCDTAACFTACVSSSCMHRLCFIPYLHFILALFTCDNSTVQSFLSVHTLCSVDSSQAVGSSLHPYSVS